jgi:hypothetical protein
MRRCRAAIVAVDVYWQGGPDVTEALNGVALSLPHLECLTSLRLTSKRISVDYAALVDAVRVHSSITHLELLPFTDLLLSSLTRLPSLMRLHCLVLPYHFTLWDVRGAALAQLPTLTTLDSCAFDDLSCLASLRALTKLRIGFAPDSEEEPIWEQSDADLQSSLFPQAFGSTAPGVAAASQSTRGPIAQDLRWRGPVPRHPL